MAYVERTIPVENSRSMALRVIVEPWGSEVLLAPGEQCEITFAGPPGEIALDDGDNWIAVWGWEGTVAWVSKNGAIVEDLRGLLVPPGLANVRPILKGHSPPYQK